MLLLLPTVLKPPPTSHNLTAQNPNKDLAQKLHKSCIDLIAIHLFVVSPEMKLPGALKLQIVKS